MAGRGPPVARLATVMVAPYVEPPGWADVVLGISHQRENVDSRTRMQSSRNCESYRTLGPGALRNLNGSLSRPGTTYQHSPVLSASMIRKNASTTSLTSRMGKWVSSRKGRIPSMMLVSAKDGHSAFTLMSWDAYSTASDRTRPTTACLLAT